jgi:hypothetical protein
MGQNKLIGELSDYGWTILPAAKFQQLYRILWEKGSDLEIKLTFHDIYKNIDNPNAFQLVIQKPIESNGCIIFAKNAAELDAKIRAVFSIITRCPKTKVIYIL